MNIYPFTKNIKNIYQNKVFTNIIWLFKFIQETKFFIVYLGLEINLSILKITIYL